MTEIEKTLGSASIIRPKLAKWLRVSERDVLRWMFWRDYGKDGVDEEQLAELKHEVMDDEWSMFEKMLEAGPPDWWMRWRCQLVAGAELSISSWVVAHNIGRVFKRDVDPAWEKRQAKERIEKFEQEKEHYLCDLTSAASDYEILGEKENAEACYDAYYKKTVGSRFAGCKWPEPPR